jgi:putative FmdB family regulatory protein
VPTYSYRCTACDTAFDIQQAFTDDTLTVCPTCQGKLRKVFSSIGVTFNGSGFYRNDSRDSGKSTIKASSGSSSTTSSDSNSKSTGASTTSTPSTSGNVSSAPSASSTGKSAAAPSAS